ncbi:Uma2 family endonuclease [Streptosporangium nondiastaticum]|uniref:Uma2 family endonuclease n=1 Tax=Streptosporangium nondiastaticum TaxID=35764 RepID=A0A9X7PFD5_9ACTN|nr:Uma2 family endonuclease [Streptosporangium nondiastaticum]PSJ25807.1 Uma2 family endonuclease [Streptosporangium nondiastaticum]
MDYARIRAVAEELSALPNAGKVEISDGTIVMMMSPSGTHELVAFRLRRQLDPQLPEGLVAHTGGDVEDPSLGILRRPDLVVLPEAAMDTPNPFHPRDVSLAAEIVSPSNHANDYAQKMRDYPALGIPVYLLIDPRKGTVAVMSDPGPGPDGPPRYRTRHDGVFGDKVSVGPWTVDTSEFPEYHS